MEGYFADNVARVIYAESLFCFGGRTLFERICYNLYPEEVLNLCSSGLILRLVCYETPPGSEHLPVTTLIDSCLRNYTRQHWSYHFDQESHCAHRGPGAVNLRAVAVNRNRANGRSDGVEHQESHTGHEE